ncbi:MAG: ABC transporter substrate-binding protein [Desulfovibrio sp.]
MSCTDPTPIKIGYVGSITGRYSELGVTARNTLNLMTEELNKAGGIDGRKVEIIAVDDKGMPSSASSALRGLIDDGVKYIIGPLTSNMAEATLEAIENQDVLVITPTMSTDYLSQRDDALLKTSGSTLGQSALIASAMKKAGKEKVAVVYDLGNKKYTEGLYKGFAREASSRGLEIVFEQPFTSNPDIDFSLLADNVIDSPADVALFIVSGLDGASLAQQIRKKKSDILLCGTSWTQSNDLILHGGKAVEGMIVIALFDYDKPAENVLEFKANYQKRYLKEPSFIFSRVHDSYSVLLSALKENGPQAPALLKNAILEKKEYQGMARKIVFDSYGDTSPALRLVVVNNGAYQDVR